MFDFYTRELKRYDRDLYAGRTKDGALCVFRKVKRYDLVCDEDTFKLYYLKEDKQLVLALTDNWALTGSPRQWGIDSVLNRIREMDLQANADFFDKLDQQNEKVDESNNRHFRNEAEAFFADNRKEFADAIDEKVGCIHSLSKDERRKRLKDRSIKNGNC